MIVFKLVPTKINRALLCGILFVFLFPYQALCQGQVLYFDGPFDVATAAYQGTVVNNRPFPYGDVQPSVMYDPSDPARLFKMWWLGSWQPSEPDLPPAQVKSGGQNPF